MGLGSGVSSSHIRPGAGGGAGAIWWQKPCRRVFVQQSAYPATLLPTAFVRGAGEAPARVTAEIQRVKARQRQNHRKRETRRKILMGAMLQDSIDRGKVPETVVRADMDQFLTRDHERALFDLPPRPKD